MTRIMKFAFLSTLVIGLSLGVSGCSQGSSAADLFAPTGSTGIVTGDWDDVNAAVQAAAQHREMSVVSETKVDDRTIRYSLITAKSEDVTVTISRDLAVDPNVRLSQEGPIAIRVVVKVGMFGDTKRERDLIDDIRTRLSDLTGSFKTAPLPKSWGGWGS